MYSMNVDQRFAFFLKPVPHQAGYQRNCVEDENLTVFV